MGPHGELLEKSSIITLWLSVDIITIGIVCLACGIASFAISLSTIPLILFSFRLRMILSAFSLLRVATLPLRR